MIHYLKHSCSMCNKELPEDKIMCPSCFDRLKDDIFNPESASNRIRRMYDDINNCKCDTSHKDL